MEAQGGLLLLDKPVGPTSHDVVSKVRRAAGLRRVGHAGTLDPFASGLLFLLLGPATRLSEYLLGLDKTYLATARLGVETTTCDPEGDVVEESGGWEELDRYGVEDALAAFRGEILQEPPVYSSKKIRGEAAHRRVRRGETVTLKEVPVTVHEIRLLDLSLPLIRFHVRCSSGTYVRSLARDLGRKLEVGAYLTDLRRTRIGSVPVEEALPLSALEEGSSWKERILTPTQALSHLPSVSVDLEEAGRLRQGQKVEVRDGDLSRESPIRVVHDGDLVAVGVVREDGLWPRKVFGA